MRIPPEYLLNASRNFTAIFSRNSWRNIIPEGVTGGFFWEFSERNPEEITAGIPVEIFRGMPGEFPGGSARIILERILGEIRRAIPKGILEKTLRKFLKEFSGDAIPAGIPLRITPRISLENLP